ncbi:MaoC family dehydratase [Pseudohoeflea coraliihabitans]|uniref:MaoC family dehydratase n=1 Tax=Pseudohoeflea coraliihabitans TaxID=2860393 RepID=A0ABS6WK79_9HYPH|nr:MaoC family dehydratase [Pseudohoeflea sp. DP4N28-3]MBW3096354.1 MaoC family dehydratase [Pseudohoeflea sp. DP4N28-3]
MPPVVTISQVPSLIGTELGLSSWMEMPQSRIDAFANVTEDHQFIHVDPEAAADTPFGGTIAHGFLTLSMLSKMHAECVPRIKEQVLGVNYGFNRLRFMNPVPSGARIRGRFELADARQRGAALMVLTLDVTIEIEGARKPALTASWLTLSQFDPARSAAEDV